MFDRESFLRDVEAGLRTAAASDPGAALRSVAIDALRRQADRLRTAREVAIPSSSTEALSAEALSAEALSAEALSAEALSAEALGEAVEAIRDYEARRAPAAEPVLLLGAAGRRIAVEASRLSELPEDLRGAVEGEVEPGALYLHPAASPRKGLGAFYTARRLAAETVRHTLREIDSRFPAVCDPSMGGGAFLLAVLRWLRRSRPDVDAAVLARRCLYGIDIDPLAVAAARLAIWVEVGSDDLSPEDLAGNLREGDALLSAPPGGDVDGGATRFEREFPEVFERGGFDAVIGNPPWDIRKPNSREFFAAHDPGYRRRSKVEALTHQRALFERSPALRRRWESHVAAHQRLSEWVRGSGAYRLQGTGDLNSYKLFLERGLDILRPGGRLGLIVPSGVHADKGAELLRRHLLERHAWEWLFMFVNRDAIFDVHRSYRFGMVVVEKDGASSEVRVAFDRRSADDLARSDRTSVEYPIEDVTFFSPRSAAFLEVQNARERDVLRRVFRDATRVGDRADLTYRREFDLTNDAPRFVDARELGDAEPDEYGVIRRGDQTLLPLYQGVMLRGYDCAAAAYVGAREHRGSRRDWCDLPLDAKRVRSRFYVDLDLARARARGRLSPRLAFRDVQNATNERTFLGAVVPPFPCGNTLPTLTTGDPLGDLALLAALGSFVVDRVLRLKMSQNHVNWFYVEELPLPPLSGAVADALVVAAARLCLIGPWFAEEWLRLRRKCGWRDVAWESLPVLTRPGRIDLRARIDAVIAWSFGLGVVDLAVILSDCDRPAAELRSAQTRGRLDPKGFWRVDRDLPPDHRHPAQTLAHLDELHRAGGDEAAAIARLVSVEVERWAPAEVEASWRRCQQQRDAFDAALSAGASGER